MKADNVKLHAKTLMDEPHRIADADSKITLKLSAPQWRFAPRLEIAIRIS
jgi:hypothetical protein